MNQRQILNAILAISILIVIFNNILFIDTTEFIPKGHEIGGILANLSLAYISSYIFYIVVVLHQENKNKKNIYSTIYNLSNQLVGRGNSVVTILAFANQFDKDNLTKTITKEEFFELCRNTNPKEICPNRGFGTAGNFIPATYSQLIYNDSYSNARVLIRDIFVYMPFLESDFIRLLNKLKESKFFIMAGVLENPHNYDDTDFKTIAESMYEYHLTIREIGYYIDKNYKKYIS